MKLIILLISIFLNFSSLGQTQNWDALVKSISKICKNENTNKLDSLFKVYKQGSKNTKYTITSKLSLERNISYEVKQRLYHFTLHKRKKLVRSLNLNLLTKKNNILHASINRSTTKNYSVIKSNSSFLYAQTNKFGLRVDTSHKYFNPVKLYMFGFACGYGATPREKAIELSKLVQNKNKKEIINWCLSLSPEIRAYGASGLLFFKEEGVQLNNNELKLLDTLITDFTPINSCSGCSGWGINFETVASGAYSGKLYLEKNK